MLKAKLRRNFKIKLNEIIYSTLTEIEVSAGVGRFNLRCHLNAVQWALDNDQTEVVEVFQIEPGCFPVLHYVNKYADGSYWDNTSGFLAESARYYIVRTIPKIDFDTLADDFKRRQEYWFEVTATFWQKLFLKQEQLL